MNDNSINVEALKPLFGPADEPNYHRKAASKPGEHAVVSKGRRPSSIPIVNSLRHALDDWRQGDYVGASETSRELLYHWFYTDHAFESASGEPLQFNYYFCQREAIETLIYLIEIRGIRSLSALKAEFEGDLEGKGVTPDEDLWPRYAFRMATGSGKTKVMSLAIVWSYFHALRESDSPMAKNFLVIAPNLTVFERLKEDFGDGRIFDKDPLIPSAWKGDWNLSVVLQDEASGAATGGTLYLTNIHRLFNGKQGRTREAETYDWAGPSVSRASALDTSEVLRTRVTSHPNLMVINDEAHHVWDPDSAWNEVLKALDEKMKERNGFGLAAQLDFSATPKDNHGNLFKHIVTDSPLGEAVDAGIVKVPIIGHVGNIKERADDNAAYRYEEHLRLGYARWKKSKEEWEPSGKKALLFVMCNSTEEADQITYRLNTDSAFEELNGKTINLHTNLKGKVKRIGKGANEVVEFVESEKDISDEDLRALRQLSRELDNNTSPYLCIVSVLMLREGWDVRNVTTIIPLRPYSSKANILPEQTLGRGLRRITLPGQALEMVTVVEHTAFTRLYRDELAQEGLPIEDVDVTTVPRTTVSIFPDPKKDWEALDILLPTLSDSLRIVSRIEEITDDEIKAIASQQKKLDLGTPRDVSIDYEGRAMITNEVVERMKLEVPLLKNGFGAISYFVKELETTCKISGSHRILAPLIERYITQDLFGQKLNLTDPRLVARLGNMDVREYIRATFVPLINQKNKIEQQRVPQGAPYSLTNWKPFQVTSSERNQVISAERTLFNLVPCNRNLEFTFATFVDLADDVVAFAKNAGPQCLRIDYEASNHRRAFYTPDFIVRVQSGKYYLVETKGEMEQEVAAKARAAVAWCKSASENRPAWEYLFVPEALFKRFNDTTLKSLASTCGPELQRLIADAQSQQPGLPFYVTTEEEKQNHRQLFISDEDFELLPELYQESITSATDLFAFLKTKPQSFSACFQPLMKAVDRAAINLMNSLLKEDIPVEKELRDRFFNVDERYYTQSEADWLRKQAASLKKLLVFSNPIMPIGILSSCMDLGRNPMSRGENNIIRLVEVKFDRFKNSQLPDRVEHIRNFRNNFIAHQTEDHEVDQETAEKEIKNWATGIAALYKALNS
ncbi:MAG: DEAD/DEAH box helicase family protein [Anaerolineaceae bacterium]